MIIGVDLGNKTRNSVCVMQGDKLLEWSRLNYADSESAWHHRQKIVLQIRKYIKKYTGNRKWPEKWPGSYKAARKNWGEK